MTEQEKNSQENEYFGGTEPKGSGKSVEETGPAVFASETDAKADAGTEESLSKELAGEISGDLSIEDAFDQLRQILERMDAEDVSLEESFQCYERGMKLIRHCNNTIDRVEKKVRVLREEGGLDEF